MSRPGKDLSAYLQKVTDESRGLIEEAEILMARLHELREELDLKMVEWHDFDVQAENDLKRIRQKGPRR